MDGLGWVLAHHLRRVCRVRPCGHTSALFRAAALGIKVCSDSAWHSVGVLVSMVGREMAMHGSNAASLTYVPLTNETEMSAGATGGGGEDH